MDPLPASFDRERFTPLDLRGTTQMAVAIGIKLLGTDGGRFEDRQDELVEYFLARDSWSHKNEIWRNQKISMMLARPVSNIRNPHRGQKSVDDEVGPEPEAPAMPDIYRDFSNSLVLNCGQNFEQVRRQKVVYPLSRTDCPIRVFAIRDEDGLAVSLVSIAPSEDVRQYAIYDGYHHTASGHQLWGTIYILAIRRDVFERVLASGTLVDEVPEPIGVELTPDDAQTKKKITGRPEEYPWAEIIDVVAYRILDIGLPDKSNDERDENGNFCWRTKADVVRFVQQFCFNSPTIVCDQPDRPGWRSIDKRWSDFFRRAEELRRDEIARLGSE